jgi:hypothetical protein
MDLAQQVIEQVSHHVPAPLSAIAELNELQLVLIGGGNLDVICG